MSARVHAFERFTTENTKHHEGARRASMLTHRDLSNLIIGLAIEVHRNVGPGLLESVYAECLSDELGQAGIPFQREVTVPVIYKGNTPRSAFARISSLAIPSLLRSKPSSHCFRRTTRRF